MRPKKFRRPVQAAPAKAASTSDALKLAAIRSRTKDESKSYIWPNQPPVLLKRVVPEGKAAPALAMDNECYSMAGVMFGTGQYAVGGFPGFPYLSQLAMRAEYRAFASALSTELTRKWIEFTSQQDDGDDSSEKIKALVAEFDRLKVRSVIQKIAELDSYFGRGQVFLNFSGQERSAPLILSPRTVRKGSLDSVVAVEPIWTTPSKYNALDPAAPDFYKPSEWFMLGQEVHASRLLTLVTRPLPDIWKPAFNFAGMSMSQLAEPYVDNWLRTRQSVADLINNFSITALATRMDQWLQGGDAGSGDIFSRAELFTNTRSNRGLMMLDKDQEELIQINTPLSGLSELQAQSQEHMCAVSHIPAMILTGISPAGLNASSEGEIRAWYDWVAANQEAYYRPIIKIILDAVQLSLFGEIDPDISFKFVPLYQMTPKEEADIRYLDMQTDAGYIDRSILSPNEVRERLARDPESGYHGLDTDVEIELPEGDDETDVGETEQAADKSVSEAQHNAMEASAHGKSTLGIPKEVGKEFVKKDAE